STMNQRDEVREGHTLELDKSSQQKGGEANTQLVSQPIETNTNSTTMSSFQTTTEQLTEEERLHQERKKELDAMFGEVERQERLEASREQKRKELEEKEKTEKELAEKKKAEQAARSKSPNSLARVHPHGENRRMSSISRNESDEILCRNMVVVENHVVFVER